MSEENSTGGFVRPVSGPANGEIVRAMTWSVGGALVTTAAVLLWLASHAQPPTGMPGGFDPEHILKGVQRLLQDPLVSAAAIAGTAWLLAGLVAASVTRRWSLNLLERVAEDRREMTKRLRSTERKLSVARQAREIWQARVSEIEQRMQLLTGEKETLQAQLDKHAQSAKKLSRESRELNRSRELLEQHIEARTLELNRFKQRYESILNSAGEGICGFDLDGRPTFVNPAAARMTGWSVESLIGNTDQQTFVGTAGAGRGPASDSEERCHDETLERKDGSRFPVEMVRTPIVENGKTTGSVLIFRDITERKRAEKRLSNKAAELERSNAELEQFAFVASHDLQEPLRKIQSFGDRLKSKSAGTLSSESMDYLDRMQNAAARMQHLIEGLLAYSRVLSRTEPFASVDLNGVVKGVLGDLELRIEKYGARVHVGGLPTIEADPVQLRQLLQNLICNALKFHRTEVTPEVTIEARVMAASEVDEGRLMSRPASGDTEVCRNRQVCELTVRDNGIGFEQQYRDRLFQVFHRLHTRHEYEGAGIGLAVCRRIAERHQGAIGAVGEPGQGATFVVVLPLQQARTEQTS